MTDKQLQRLIRRLRENDRLDKLDLRKEGFPNLTRQQWIAWCEALLEKCRQDGGEHRR